MSDPRPSSKTTLRNVRRAVQLAFLFAWLGLFVVTRGPVTEAIRTDLFLITDPLVAAVAMAAARIFVPTLLLALVFVVLTLVLGRVFCGWVCPLGTLNDATARVLRPPESRFTEKTHQRMLRWKYWVLALLMAAAIGSSQLVWLLDPLVLLFRAVATGIYPVVTGVLPAGALPEALRQTEHAVAFGPLALLLVILGLTAITPRFYCRYLCPLGALYALLARLPLLRRRVTKDCDACDGLDEQGTAKRCAAACRMGAIPENPRKTRNHECIRCLTCRSLCHAGADCFEFRPPVTEKQDRPFDVGRRGFLVASVTGLALAPVISRSTGPRGEPLLVVRPPRVLDEETFLDLCVRCGMCVQACPSQTLQPTHLESGLAGFWSPAVTPRINGCIPDCNACSLVCATEAIPPFSRRTEDKWATKMGTAMFESGRCISYTEKVGCRRCIDICPTRAVIIDESPGRHPVRPASVDFMRCMGCGLCEYVCRLVVFGQPAIVNWAHGRGQPTVIGG